MKLEKSATLAVIAAALKEDVGPRDLTTATLIPKDQQAKGELVIREEGVVAGLEVAEWTFGLVDSKIRFKPTVSDGESVHPGKVVAFLEGPARGILTAERTALNFLGHLSGIATLTRRHVERVRGTKAQILDTRKTTPTLRFLEKYAVAMGGGVPHRMGLYDQILIKDNHLQLIAARIRQSLGIFSSLPHADHAAHRLSAIEEAVREARGTFRKEIIVEVEVTNLKEFRQALAAKADMILLDNMKFSEIQEAVRLRNAVARSVRGSTGSPRTVSAFPVRPEQSRRAQVKPLLEVSGGVTLETVEGIASTGVDRISIGALTHSAPALDVALELVG